jgi:PTS system nitrogen regulatory IIA component
MHVGATLKLLRLDAGLGLRDLARRIGVSSAYLSRVEHGIDPVPTSARLAAIARELEIPPALLIDAASRISPLVRSYVDTIPGAGALFLEIARRRLTSPQLAIVHEFIADRFPAHNASSEWLPALEPLLAPDRVIPKLRCSELTDALDVAAVRLAPAVGVAAPDLARALRAREDDAPSLLGCGVAVPRAYINGANTAAALVSFAEPLASPIKGAEPLQLLVVLVGERTASMLTLITHVARLTAHGLAQAIAPLDDATWALERLQELEAVR